LASYSEQIDSLDLSCHAAPPCWQISAPRRGTLVDARADATPIHLLRGALATSEGSGCVLTRRVAFHQPVAVNEIGWLARIDVDRFFTAHFFLTSVFRGASPLSFDVHAVSRGEVQ
jgi:hypothetical protein